MSTYGLWNINGSTLNWSSTKDTCDATHREMAIVTLAAINVLLRYVDHAHPTLRVGGFARIGYGVTVLTGIAIFGDSKAKEGLLAGSRRHQMHWLGFFQIARGAISLWTPQRAPRIHFWLDSLGTVANLLTALGVILMQSKNKENGPHQPRFLVNAVVGSLNAVDVWLFLEGNDIYKLGLLPSA